MAAESSLAKKLRGRDRGPSEYDSPKSMSFYFFFDDFLVFFAAFFFVAILLTTFHAVRDLPVAHPWHQVPDDSGKLFSDEGGKLGRRGRDDHRQDLNYASSFW